MCLGCRAMTKNGQSQGAALEHIAVLLRNRLVREEAPSSCPRALRIDDDLDFLRLILCTPTVAADLESEKCDIVVTLDAFECLHERMAWPLIQMDGRFRLLGLLPASRAPNPYEVARLRVTFGFRSLELRCPGRVISYALVRRSGDAPQGSVLEHPVAGVPHTREFVDPLRRGDESSRDAMAKTAVVVQGARKAAQLRWNGFAWRTPIRDSGGWRTSGLCFPIPLVKPFSPWLRGSLLNLFPADERRRLSMLARSRGR